jgi:hypothetical protein
MALVKGRYYQHSVRINGRVTTQFYGRGEIARLLDEDYVLIAAERLWERREARDRDDEQRHLYQAERDHGEALKVLVAVVLEGFGYHKPQRRVWRRKRMGTMQARTRAQAPPEPADEQSIRAEMRRLVKAIGQDRDESAVERLRILAKEHPRFAAAVVRCDLPRRARELFAKNLFEGREEDRAETDGLIAQMALRVRDLAGPSPSPALRLAAEAAGIEWAHFWLIMLFATARDNLCNEHPRFTQRRTAALKRFMYSLRTVEQIRALERPVVMATQINVQT